MRKSKGVQRHRLDALGQKSAQIPELSRLRRLTHNTSVCSTDHFQSSIIAVEVEAALGGEPIAVATDIGPRDVRVGGSPEDGRCPHHGNTTSSASRFSAVYNDGRNRERYLNSVWACCISCRPITSGMMLGSSSGGRPVSA